MIIGSHILIGNFCALAASAVAAIYNAQSGQLIKTRKIPMSFYFAILSIFMIVVCFLMGRSIGEDIELYSINPLNGVFGMFSSKYGFLFMIIGKIYCLVFLDLE